MERAINATFRVRRQNTTPPSVGKAGIKGIERGAANVDVTIPSQITTDPPLKENSAHSRLTSDRTMCYIDFCPKNSTGHCINEAKHFSNGRTSPEGDLAEATPHGRKSERQDERARAVFRAVQYAYCDSEIFRIAGSLWLRYIQERIVSQHLWGRYSGCCLSLKCHDSRLTPPHPHGLGTSRLSPPCFDG